MALQGQGHNSLLYHEPQVNCLFVSEANGTPRCLESTARPFASQVAALCGVHCLNTLLQGPYFSEVELSQVQLQAVVLMDSSP